MKIKNAKIDPLWWQKRGLMFTSTGYGSAIPTEYKIQLEGTKRWYRVYCYIFSNCGTLYIKRGKCPKGQRYTIENIVDGTDIQEALAASSI